MTKKYSVQKTQKLARAFKTVFSVFYIASAAFLAISAVLAAVSIFAPGDLFTIKNLKSSGIFLDVGQHFRYNLSETGVPDNTNLRTVFTGIFGASIIYSLSYMFIFKNIKDILMTVAAGTPFDIRNSARIKNISAIVIGGSFLFSVINELVSGRIIAVLGIKNISINYMVDWFLLMTGFLILILSGVFRYGSYLQKEHDETV